MPLAVTECFVKAIRCQVIKVYLVQEKVASLVEGKNLVLRVNQNLA